MGTLIKYVLLLDLSLGILASEIMEEVLCEKKVVTIRCPAGQTITLLSANYGRLDTSVCRGGHIATTTCVLPETLALLSYCEGEQQCPLAAHNAAFGDPCPGVFKYLLVRYQCRNPPEPAQSTSQPLLPSSTSSPVSCMSPAADGTADAGLVTREEGSSLEASTLEGSTLTAIQRPRQPSCSLRASLAGIGVVASVSGLVVILVISIIIVAVKFRKYKSKNHDNLEEDGCHGLQSRVKVDESFYVTPPIVPPSPYAGLKISPDDDDSCDRYDNIERKTGEDLSVYEYVNVPTPIVS